MTDAAPKAGPVFCARAALTFTTANGHAGKRAIIALVDSGGDVRSFHIPHETIKRHCCIARA
jgi:hypothetical protein